MTSTTPENVPTQQPRKTRQSLIAFGLAALAVGGIGAAMTSAAWTDNTWFSAPAAAATFNLQGSLDGKTWEEGTLTTANGVTTFQLEVPAEKLANLLPGEDRDVSLWVRNESSVSAAITSTVAFEDGTTFTTKPTPTLVGLAEKLTPAGEDEFELNITTPADWDDSNIGGAGLVVITVTATATS